MYAYRGWRYWLPRAAAVLGLLGLGCFLASRLLLKPTPVSEAPKAQLQESETELAGLERLVTVVPPKTQNPYVTALKDSHSVALCFTLTNPGRANMIIDGLNVAHVKAGLFVYGKDVGDLREVLQRAKTEGHSIGSLGYQPADFNTLTRDQLDQSFKATTHALFEAIGERPRFYGVTGATPKQDVIDYAAINGMVTLRLTLYDPSVDPRKITTLPFMPDTVAGRYSLNDLADGLTDMGFHLVGLEDEFPLVKKGQK